MPGQRPILVMGFVASVGITFEILACTTPRGQGNFWPLLNYLFYILLPLPMLVTRSIMKDPIIGISEGNAARYRDYALFVTAGIMVSTVAFPIVLARSPAANPLIKPMACFLTEVGNLLCLATIGLFCIYFKPIN